MREARIILPLLGVATSLHLHLEDILLQKFGGVTRYEAYGAWLSKDRIIRETVRIYDIAYEQTRLNDAWLYDTAWMLRETGRQEEVYLRYGNGHVQMVAERGCMDNGEFDWDTLASDLHRHPDNPNDVAEVAEHVEIPLVPHDIG